MKTRTDLLNHLIKKHNLKRYLEIGVQNPMQNFDKIECDYKVSVDPDENAYATFCMTSDQFFKNVGVLRQRFGGEDSKSIFINKKLEDCFDIVFIDGLHTADQVKKDFTNALKILSSNGFIVLHDCNPLLEEHTIVPRPTKTGHWHGDVYKFASLLSSYENFNTVDIDCGCGVWKNNGSYLVASNAEYSWAEFSENRKELLNLFSWDEFTMLP